MRPFIRAIKGHRFSLRARGYCLLSHINDAVGPPPEAGAEVSFAPVCPRPGAPNRAAVEVRPRQSVQGPCGGASG
eukprot:11185542-Lingulodinium_polyedra.AAC.1